MMTFPRVPKYEVEAVLDWLCRIETHYRPPIATAKFLAFVVELHARGGLPFPPYKDAAEHLGVSVPLIDTQLSQRQGTGHITISRGPPLPGNVKGRVSSRINRIVTPCDELIGVVAAARERRAIQMSVRGSMGARARWAKHGRP